MVVVLAIVIVASWMFVQHLHFGDRHSVAAHPSFGWSSMAIQAALETAKIQDKGPTNTTFGLIADDIFNGNQVQETAKAMTEGYKSEPTGNDPVVFTFGRNN